MKIPEWPSHKDQMSNIGNHHWSVPRLIELSKDFEAKDAPLDFLNVYDRFKNISLREMAMHIRAVNDSDLSCPIILDEDGEIMDGRHRIIKALLNGDETIKAVRFDENPTPCKIDND